MNEEDANAFYFHSNESDAIHSYKIIVLCIGLIIRGYLTYVPIRQSRMRNMKIVTLSRHFVHFTLTIATRYI